MLSSSFIASLSPFVFFFYRLYFGTETNKYQNNESPRKTAYLVIFQIGT